jgi:hypothetical protein
MRHISSRGATDEEIIDFFRHPIQGISLSQMEGNRAFEALICAGSGSKLSISSCIFEISALDEIGIISINQSEKDDLENQIEMPSDFLVVDSIHKIIGDFSSDESCECGIVIETAVGIISLFSGSFPGSLNVVCPMFNQNLHLTSFQKFKYHLKPIKIY